MPRSLPFLNRCPLSHVSEVFNRKRSIRVFSFRDQFFGNSMVGVCLKTTLLATQFLQSAFGRPGADLLQNISAFLIPLTILLNCIAAIALPVTVSGKIDDAKVYTDSIINFFGGWFQNIAHRKQKEITLAIDQIRFTLTRFKQLLLTFSAYVGNQLTRSDSPDVDGLLLSPPSQNPVIKSNGAKRFEFALGLLMQFVSVGNFGDTTDNYLSRQAGRFSDLRVKGLVNGVLSKGLRMESKFTDGVTSMVCLSKLACSLVGLSFTSAINFTLKVSHTFKS